MARMITVPQKKGYEVNMVNPLKQFITQTYTSNVDDYLKSVDALNMLRSEAVFRSSRQDKINKLMRYFDQLTAIETKLPINENQIRIPFKWQDAFDKGSLFGRSSLTFSSGLYERLSVLFNMAACCSEVASSQHYDSEDSLKSAAKLYNTAAGAFSYIRDNALTATRNDCTSDFFPETLTVLISTMLAQAQEIIYFKTVKDKMNPNTISKIAIQCSDHYAEAMRSVQVDSLKELHKLWFTTLAGKQALYHALAEYHMAEFHYAEQNIGKAIAHAKKALELIKTAEQRGGKDSQFKNQINIIQAFHDKAQKDNQMIYYERIPDHASLGPLERANVAKAIPVKFPISEDFKDLFTGMVPIAIHNGLQAFKAKRMECLNIEIGKLRQATDLLNSALSAWNLPASIEDASGASKLPQSILDKSQIIKDKGGITKIDQMMSELAPLLNRNLEILNEAKRALDDEERSDSELRTQMKEKWTRTPSRQLNDYLYGEIKQYENIIENAVKANRIVEEKYAKNRDSIQLLSKAHHEISNALPPASPVAALQNTHVIKDLRRLMNEVEGMRDVREVLESEVKALDSDASTARIVSQLQNSTSLDEHAVIQNELDELMTTIRKQIREHIQEQEKLLGYIEKANSDFSKEKTHNETSKLREEMLKNLSTASDSFNELFNHLNEGTKFYNDLTPILVKFQSKVMDFVFARKTEKEDLMKDIQTNIARPATGNNRAPQIPDRPNNSAPARPPPPAATSNPTYPHPPGPNAQTPYPYYPAMPSAYYPYPTGGYPSYPGQPQHPPKP